MSFSKQDIINIKNELTKYQTKDELDTIARKILLKKGNDRFSARNTTKDINEFRKMCLILKANDFDIEKAVEMTKKYKKYKSANDPLFLKNKWYSLFLEYFDVAKIKQEIAKNKRYHNQIDNSVKRMKNVISFFNLNSNQLEERLAQIYRGEEIPQEEYLKELYTLRQLFLAKAKGEIAQTTTNVIYEVEEDEEGNVYNKKIYVNKNGKKLLNVEYKSQLPDEKALVALRVIDEMIIQASVDNGDTITDEELEKMYDNYLKDINKQRKEYMLIEEKKD